MDYKKLYKEALEKAKEYWETDNNNTLDIKAKGTMEYLFPELRESEDERIRKEIIAILKGEISYTSKENAQKYIAWLEKQGKESITIDADPVVSYNNVMISDDKIKPKFEPGDWVTCEELNTAKIININNDRYEVEFIDGYKGFPYIDYVDRLFHLWSIKDAKNGDVLASELCDSIILFKGIKDNNIDFYCDYDFSEIDVPGNRFSINNGQHYGSVEDSKDFHPATKEQRDLLFKKMHEFGYEWNAEKKELRKCEQNPKHNIEGLARGEDYGIDGLWHAIYILEKTFGDVSGYQSDDGILEHECAISAVKELYDKKPTEWSEEDSKIIEEIINDIECARAINYHAPKEGYEFRENWLKSLKDRCTWKPSDEQMDALHYVFQHYTPNLAERLAWDSVKTLELMYQDLKKLKK